MTEEQMTFRENEDQKKFYLSLGRFIEHFSITENNARFVLEAALNYMGEQPIKNISKIKLSDLIDRAEAVFRDDDKLANRDWKKLREISTLRNKALHTITREDENGFYVGPDILNPFQGPGEILRADAKTLDAATIDLQIINSAIAYRFNQVTQYRHNVTDLSLEIMMRGFLTRGLDPWNYNS